MGGVSVRGWVGRALPIMGIGRGLDEKTWGVSRSEGGYGIRGAQLSEARFPTPRSWDRRVPGGEAPCGSPGFLMGTPPRFVGTSGAMGDTRSNHKGSDPLNVSN